MMISGAVLATALLGDLPAAAQQERPQSQREQERALGQPERGPADSEGWRQLRGTVKRLKRVSLKGAEGEHLVALVAGNGGRRMVVDLGPASAFRETPVMTGDRIAVRGPFAWVSDRKVLFAQRVHVNGETIQVTRERNVDRRQLDRRIRQPGETPVTGQIEESKELRLRGVNRRHVVVRLKTDDGRHMLADLGTPQDIAALSLESGRSITVEGPTISVNGKPLVLARHVIADGKRAEVDRDIGTVPPSTAGGRAEGLTEGDRTPPSGRLSMEPAPEAEELPLSQTK
ncbi:MAG TPA: hypothetical protein VFS39_12625 [Nitrospira sp.]|nr:hypothetical protein [Nitrospira sp.]